jgi:hypothetical protein
MPAKIRIARPTKAGWYFQIASFVCFIAAVLLTPTIVGSIVAIVLCVIFGLVARALNKPIACSECRTFVNRTDSCCPRCGASFALQSDL